MGTLILNPSADTSIVNSVPSNNYGAVVYIYSGEQISVSTIYRMLIQFDLTLLPSTATLTSTTLRLYIYGDYAANARTHRVYRVMVSWLEGDKAGTLDSPASGATWQRRNTTTSWTVFGCGGVGSDREGSEIGSISLGAAESSGWKEITLTPTTKSALDLGYGWLMKADTETDDMYAFYSRDYTTDTSLRPQLVIEYTMPEPAGISRNNVGRIALVQYASPDLIPYDLKPVGIVSSATLPKRLKVVDPVWVSHKALAPANMVCYGAVVYESADLIPRGMLSLGVEA